MFGFVANSVDEELAAELEKLNLFENGWMLD